MLVISKEKDKELQKAIRKTNREEMQTQLAEIFPTLPKEELDRFIDTGLEKTARYGIDEQTAVKDFVRLMIIVAQNFDEHPKANKQLTRRDANPNLRVRLARELLTPDEWREAAGHGPKADLGSQKYYV